MYVAKMVQSVADKYEDLKSSDDDNQVVIYTLKGEQVGTKRKGDVKICANQNGAVKEDESGLPDAFNV